VFQADGAVTENPELRIRREAEQLILSRKWSTSSIFFGDQPESNSEHKKSWSITFNLGLDHLPAAGDAWLSDAEAIVNFVTDVSKRLNSEFILEVRSTSKLWWSLTVAIVSGEKPDMSIVRSMVKRVALHTGR
jgi:hypothetical protein